MDEVIQIGDLACTVVCQSEKPNAASIFCHGFGAPGTDLVPIAGELIRSIPELSQMAFLFPQAPIEIDPMFDSRAWWMIDIEKIQSLMMQGEFRELRDSKPAELITRRNQVNKVVDHARSQYQLEADKIILGGFSQGAMLATDVALHYPEKLAGVIVWSGTLLNEAEWTNAAKNKQPLTFVQSHGRLDPILPFKGAELLRDMLTDSNHDVEFIPFQGQHTIGTEALVASARLLTAAIR